MHVATVRVGPLPISLATYEPAPRCRLSFKLSSLAAALVATLVVATLGDVLLARCSGSGLWVNLLPTHLVRELAAELGGYGATQSALAVESLLCGLRP